MSLKETWQVAILSSFLPRWLIHSTQPYQILTIADSPNHWSNVNYGLGSVSDFNYLCLHIAINQWSSSRCCMTRLYFESVSRYHDNIKSSKDALCTATYLWVCCPPTLKARSNFKCSFNVSYLGKTVFTLQCNCFHEAHSFHSTEHSRYFLPSLIITLASCDLLVQ